MYAPLPSALKPARVLFLSRSKASVRTDVKALRGLGITQCAHESESARAVLLLQDEQARRQKESGAKTGGCNAVDLVICDERLADAPTSALLYEMSKKPALSAQPVLVIASSSASASGLRAAGVYVLQRPYRPEELGRMIQKAMSPMRRRLNEAAFAKAADSNRLSISPKIPRSLNATAPKPLTANDWYRKGIDALKSGRPRSAEQAFLQVLKRQEDHIDAALGLARICRAHDDAKGMRQWFVRAAANGRRQGDMSRAEVISAMLPEEMRRNIFAHEAAAHIERGAYRLAALSFLDAGRERPEVPLYQQIARTCLLTSTPEANMNLLCGAFDELGRKATASFLRRRLLQYAPCHPRPKPSWLDKYPLLKETVSVAAYAACAWKEA